MSDVVENQKICRIIEEFSLYLLEEGNEFLQIRVKKSLNRVSLIFVCDTIDREKLIELEHIFQYKRQQAFELYGWELIGQGDSENELNLVSTLINYYTYYIQDGKVIFNLVRYE